MCVCFALVPTSSQCHARFCEQWLMLGSIFSSFAGFFPRCIQAVFVFGTTKIRCVVLHATRYEFQYNWSDHPPRDLRIEILLNWDVSIAQRFKISGYPHDRLCIQRQTALLLLISYPR